MGVPPPGSAHHARHGLHHAHAEVEIDVIHYATMYTTKMKAKFAYCDRIKFNEPVLKPGTPDSNVSLTTTC